MSAATPRPAALPPCPAHPVPVVPVDEHAHEIFAAHLTMMGAHIAAAIVAMVSLPLLQATRRVVVDDVQAQGAQGVADPRWVELTLRTLALMLDGAYPAVVDALEAAECSSCDDCWETSLVARAYMLCGECQQHVEAGALVVVDELVVDDDVAPTEPPPDADVGNEVPCGLCHGTGVSSHGGPCGLCAPRPGLRRCDAAIDGELLVEVGW